MSQVSVFRISPSPPKMTHVAHGRLSAQDTPIHMGKSTLSKDVSAPESMPQDKHLVSIVNRLRSKSHFWDYSFSSP